MLGDISHSGQIGKFQQLACTLRALRPIDRPISSLIAVVGKRD